MICNFSWCEFYNVVLGGILTGVVASLLFVCLSSLFRTIKFKSRYRHLNSYNKTFDWTAYSMKQDNGREREEKPNGATATIKVKSDSIKIILEHSSTDKRRWTGELQLLKPNSGTLALKYDDAYEFDKREAFIGSYVEDGKIVDYIFLISTMNKIYRIKNEVSQSVPEYNYGNEILIRKRLN